MVRNVVEKGRRRQDVESILSSGACSALRLDGSVSESHRVAPASL